MSKLTEEFYMRSSDIVANDLLGKFLVFYSSKGILSTLITEVEINPTLKIRKRHKKPGQILLSRNIKKKFQLAILAGNEFQLKPIVIRQGLPREGIETMKDNFGGEVFNNRDMTRFPGSLYKSFEITSDLDGLSIVTSNLFIEDRSMFVDPGRTVISKGKRERSRYMSK